MHRLKHWQIFLLFFAPIFCSLHIEDSYFRDLVNCISLLPIIFYFFSVGIYLSDKNKADNLLFTFNCIYLTASVVLIAGLGGDFLSDYVLPTIMLLVYFLLAYIQVIDHLTVQLRIAEGKLVDDYKQSTDFVLFFIWPIGLWTLQPRIDKIR